MRKYYYPFLIAATGILLGCIFLFSKSPVSKAPAYKERKGEIALSGEWLNTKKAIEGLLAEIDRNPSNTKAMLELAQAYIQESRITGDHAYYDAAALSLLDQVLKNDPDNFEALCCQATVLLSQHHFAEGLVVAKKALPINPHNAFIYGILCDANLELGHYTEAVAMADSMIAVRPDIRSYSRASYLREVYGDIPGARSAMKLAVSSGYPGLEQTEWARCVLGHLYETTGDLDSAAAEYDLALQERPNYPFAIAGLGRVAKARGDYKQAIAYFERSKNMIVEYSFADELTDLYKLSNNMAKAASNASEVIAMLSPGNDVEGQAGHGHYADRELAYAYLKVNKINDAFDHATIEYERRPDNIDVCETLGWVNYKKGNYSEANKLIDKALRTNSSNPVLLCRAGLIKIKAGEVAKGKLLLKRGVETNPFIDPELKKEVNPYLS